MFTFVVTCYNQADVVRYALESIRYQIEQYGEGQSFQLVVTDDGSTDKSVGVIDQWIAGNKGLFAKTDRLFRKENAGICRNYVDALKRVAGERFLVLNGDDLLAPFNVFEITDLLDKYDLVCTAFIKFTGKGDMIRSYGTYLEVVLQNYMKGKVLRRAGRLGCPVMGTAVYRKELLTKEVFDFILQYRTVNDRACFQKIVDDHEGIRVCYVNRPFVMYRISEHSISNFNSPTRKLHNQEVGMLCRAEMEGEKQGFMRVVLKLQEKSAAVRSHANYFVRFFRFFSPYYFIMLWITILHYPQIRKMERQLIDSYWLDCREHYRRIRVWIHKEAKMRHRHEKGSTSGKE